MSKSKILFQVSGSIAAFKSAAVVSQLVKDGFEVKVVFSQNASRFIGAATFEGLTGKAVYTDMFHPTEPMAHIDLARWADIVVLCPASAHMIAKLAHGLADDLIGTLFLAKEPKLPYLIFPAMNVQMWNSVPVQKNCEFLNQIPGVKVIEPAKGDLACGEFGEGRLPEPTDIIKHIHRHLKGADSAQANTGSILITGGGTSEPIDSVRSITNFSTGKTSVGLAEHLSDAGFQVDLLLSNTALVKPEGNVQVKRFTTHGDLQNLLQSQLMKNKYRAVVHLAAVSDYQMKEVVAGKISSSEASLDLSLKPTVKIVSSIKEWSQNKDTKVVAFKLTSDVSPEDGLQQAEDLMQKNDLDAVVLNDLASVEKNHAGLLLSSDHPPRRFDNKRELFDTLETFLKEDV